MLGNSNVTIMVKDMDKSVDFYTNILGFKIKERYGNEWAGIYGEDINIGLHPNKNFKGKETSSENISIGFQVEDLDNIVKELSKKGVKFRVAEEKFLRFAFFNDPDGTNLYLTQLKEKKRKTIK